jgi:formamidopyrimidine-DNA glycosylase
MPELPEAETIARDLRDRVVGAKIVGVDVIHPGLLGPGLEPGRLRSALVGRKITEIGRRGKNLVLHFEGDWILRVNLGMTGRLIVSDSPRATEFRHVAVRFDLEDGRAILYDDIRRFGRIDLHTPESWAEWEGTMGVEPLSDEFTGKLLHNLTAASRTPIRNWLLDQHRIAGIGNIYAIEALWHARIHPARPANSLSAREAVHLRDALRKVLRESIEARGTTISDYRDSSGEAGGYSARLMVYGREGEPCPRCGTPIERIVLSNRSAFFCPRCQPMGAKRATRRAHRLTP